MITGIAATDAAVDMCLQDGIFGVGAIVQVMMKL